MLKNQYQSIQKEADIKTEFDHIAGLVGRLMNVAIFIYISTKGHIIMKKIKAESY